MTDASPQRPLSIHIIAAEESGDLLGAALARALRACEGEAITLSGLGGRAMAAAGIASAFPIDDFSHVGIIGVVRHLPMIFRRIRQTVDAALSARPDAIVIVDSPDFTHRVARRIRHLAPSIPILDYVSPSVWAWRPRRARAMRSYIDCVLAILPFEPATYARLGGPPCVYVGHPLTGRLGLLRPDADEAKRRRSEPPILLALPGSRSSEIKRLLAIFGAAIGRVREQAGPTEVVLPTLPHLAAGVRAGAQGWPVPPRIVVDPAEKWAAFRTARAALAASGTVTLELALAGVPTAAAYRVPRIEEIVLRRLITGVDTVILANLVLGEKAIPEFLQQACNPEQLAGALLPLLSDTPERARQLAAFARLDGIIEAGTDPSAKAAALVADFARRGRRNDPAVVGTAPGL
jgi:lipid-A-disaccharide synthase